LLAARLPVRSTTVQALRPGAATALDAATLEAVAGDAPSASLGATQVVGVMVAELLVTAKLQPSKGAARKCGLYGYMTARLPIDPLPI
jgi:hypothetical protein